ncbi:Hypothetical_protein [Hexamita inflata]|uniref:Hypothetical_protein n=1 Tax=Hexamita inflata TaxID=28002 RepID=A0AA86PYU8_9EUKA|nr:Hypothetical protein HINF_LOCUS30279 [Hexamita inflata]
MVIEQSKRMHYFIQEEYCLYSNSIQFIDAFQLIEKIELNLPVANVEFPHTDHCIEFQINNKIYERQFPILFLHLLERTFNLVNIFQNRLRTKLKQYFKLTKNIKHGEIDADSVLKLIIKFQSNFIKSNQSNKVVLLQ